METRPAQRGNPHYRYRWLLVIPFIWQAGLAPVVNHVSWSPLGLPFPMLWQMAGIVLTSLLIGLVFMLDRAHGVEQEEAAYLQATPASTGDAQ
ncbi:DUF3311 domain-containing protein [Paraburkholderia sp. 22099]|jgi:hypothetical protein|uniref:Solute:sodium symporter small subunit n=1 Tax=Paraburkholderia terricola TaxID=169427 RepID=A0ABU1LUK1_9BURK|nr:DUF3311 domain-containing protein [Paraburkholderia terricola]MDR6410344.1 hypothetical protein [Paraburkholderia terricola]MDR6481504.1 hypothetical protein [Paraburkholderia terricola]MDR6491709.1 hypothetical protein [Paraburkholderia terricola]